MPPKRKHADPFPDEERVVKRQLRSREITTPTPSPTKSTAKTRRALPSPRKRGPGAKKLDNGQQNSINNNSEDEIRLGVATKPQDSPTSAPHPTTSTTETRFFSDETNLARPSSALNPKETIPSVIEKPRGRRGRPPTAAPIIESAGLEDGLVKSEVVISEVVVKKLPTTPKKTKSNIFHQLSPSTPTVEVIICKPSKNPSEAIISRKNPKSLKGVSSALEDEPPGPSKRGKWTSAARTPSKAARKQQVELEWSDTEGREQEASTPTPMKRTKQLPVSRTPLKATRKRAEPERSNPSDIAPIGHELLAQSPSKRARKLPASRTPSKAARRPQMESGPSKLFETELTEPITPPPKKTKPVASRAASKQATPVVESNTHEQSASSDDDDENLDTSHSRASRPSAPLVPPVIETVPEEHNLDDEDEDIELPMSPTKKRLNCAQNTSLADLSSALPVHLHSCLSAYKGAVLKNLHCPGISTSNPYAEGSPSDIANKQLTDLIDGTALRAEGNSCLLLGPRGSGKSQIVENCLKTVAFQKPIILRLSGWVQSTDRHALREIAFQLLQQTGSSLLPDSILDSPHPVIEDKGEENPFLDHASSEPTITLPPSAHLHALIPVLLTLSRPVIVILEAFDLFALHPRQSLLYCLLDTVQNCRASSESRGLAVIGVTSRVDTVQLLEKRVKSRFSGRTIRTAPPSDLQTCLGLVRNILQPSGVCGDDDLENEWNERWLPSVEKFLADKNVVNTFNETFSITRNLKVITRILTTCVVHLTPRQPYLTFKVMAASANSQRSRPRSLHLANLSYPWLCLLIASVHADTAGHPIFTFEMLYETFHDQVRASASAPVQVNGGSIGMVRCTREVFISAFEEMVAAKIFVCTVAPSSSVTKEFMKHRCMVDRNDIKAIIEKSGQTNLKKWLNKGN